jgi:predicted Zn-dependent protease
MTLSERELRAIMAHDLGHVHLGHVTRAQDRKRLQAAGAKDCPAAR